jgi:hypothetical protein
MQCGRSWWPRLTRDKTMPLLSAPSGPGELDHRLRDASAVTPELMSQIVDETCQRYPPIRRTTKSLRIERLLQSGAWTDAALALIDLELPQWQVRRIVYDEGEWHCALSRQRELPEWLDQSIEICHADLPLAMLMAFVDARRIDTPSPFTSVPAAPRHADALYGPVCCDNFA